MFSNLIYFVIVLLIYNIYHPPDDTSFSGGTTLLLWAGLVALFILINRVAFGRIARRFHQENPARLDHHFNTAMQRQSIMAIALFAVSIYLLNLPDFLRHLPIFTTLPTFLAALFLGIFIGYLSIVWWVSFPLHRRLYNPEQPLRAHIISQIRFSLPILLPWFLLSGLTDLLTLVPLRQPAAFLATTAGEVIYFLFFMLIIALAGPLLVQKFWGCRPLPDGFMRSRIVAVCQRAGLRYADILYWPIYEGRMITAGVMGLVRRFRYLLVTRALLRYLRPEEVEAVIAHEIGHVKKNHLLFYLFFFSGYMLLSLVTFDLVLFGLFLATPVNRLAAITGIPINTLISGLFSVIVILLFLLYFRYIFGFFMRNFERQADTFVYQLFNSAHPLISTLEKISQTSGQAADKPNWHHFSIAQRIDYLQRCEHDRSWIRRHDLKIRRSIGIYIVTLLAVVGAGYSLNYGAAGGPLRAYIQEKALLRLVEKAPHNADLLAVLGDYHYAAGRQAEAVTTYQRALRLDAAHSHALNNLAWIYATTEIQELQDPPQALALARRAAELNPVAHVLDTLAESYYANGRYLEAWQTGRRALAAAAEPEYYARQLTRFEEALGR